MQDSDHTPRQPNFELDRNLGDLTTDELLEIEALIDDSKPLEKELAAKLYNAYIRESMTVAGLYPALGPSDDDIMQGVQRPLYSTRLWNAKRDEEGLDPVEDEDDYDDEEEWDEEAEEDGESGSGDPADQG